MYLHVVIKIPSWWQEEKDLLPERRTDGQGAPSDVYDSGESLADTALLLKWKSVEEGLKWPGEWCNLLQ